MSTKILPNNKAIRIRSLIIGVGVSAALLVGCSGPGSKQTLSDYVDDSVVTSRVKAALIKDPDVSGYAVEVATLGRIVQLSGFVESHLQRRRALEVAKKTKGVTEVRDAIIVRR